MTNAVAKSTTAGERDRDPDGVENRVLAEEARERPDAHQREHPDDPHRERDRHLACAARPSRACPACPTPWITLPEVRKSSALNAAWVTRWKKANAHAPTPSAANMNPSWLMVEYASTFLMSRCGIAASAAPNAEISPAASRTVRAVGAASKSGHVACDQEHARSDHRRRVDERRDRRRTLHGVRQPDVERELRRLADRADREQHGSSRERRRSHRRAVPP